MPTVETIVLDPPEFADDREPLELDVLGLAVREAEWGDSEHELFLVKKAIGEVPADSHPPNRTATLKLRVKEEGGLSVITNYARNPRFTSESGAGSFAQWGADPATGILPPGYHINAGATLQGPYTYDPVETDSDGDLIRTYAHVNMPNNGINFTGACAKLGPSTWIAGRTYTASVLLYHASGNNDPAIILGHASADSSPFQLNNIVSSWVRYFVSWTPSADRADAWFCIRNPWGIGQASNIAFSNLIVYEGTQADFPGYFDGDFPNDESVIHSWAGTEHESASTKQQSISLASVAQKLQQKVGIIQREGGWVRRDLDPEGGFESSVAYQVHGASLGGLHGWMMAHREAAPDVTLVLNTGPYCYGVIEKPDNVLQNPAFESAIASPPWSTYVSSGSSNVTRVADSTSRHGDYVANVAASGMAASQISMLNYTGVPTLQPISPGERAFIRGRMKYQSGPLDGSVVMELQVRYFKADGSYNGEAAITGSKRNVFAPVIGEWYDLEGISPVMPADTAAVGMGFFVYSPSSGSGHNPVFRADEAMVVPGVEVGHTEEYSDGGIFEETSARELVFRMNRIKGSAPGLIRARAQNKSASNWRGVALALESRDHQSESTAALAYECEALTPEGGAATAALAGSSGGNVISHTNLPNTWTAILSSRIVANAAEMTHYGARRLWMRIYDPGSIAGAVQLRMEWRALGAGRWTPGRIISTPFTNNFAIIDLGEASPSRAIIGDQRWEWRILARTTGTAGADIYLDRVWILPNEQMAVVREPIQLEDPSNILLRDEFNQSSGGLSGETLAAAGSFVGPSSGGTFADDASVGVKAWSNPSNASSSNDSRATAAVGTNQTHYLKATNFGFAIPAGATINGIQVDVERSQSVPGVCFDSAVRIVKGGAIGSTDRALWGDISGNGTQWPDVDVYQSYGSSTDLWGTTWTVADINASNFGFAISAYSSGLVTVPQIDHIRITIYYTPSGGQAWSGAGDADDFNNSGTPNFNVTRTAVADAASTPRYEIAGSTIFTNQVVQAKLSSSSATGDAERGVLLRYFDSGNWIAATISSQGWLTIRKAMSSSWTQIYPSKQFAQLQGIGPFMLTAMALTTGEIAVWADGNLLAIVVDSAAAAGGSLDDGKAGLIDYKSSATAETRTYDEFAVWQPEIDAVAFGNRAIEFRSDGVFRQHASIDAWARIVPDGFLPYASPSGLEGRAMRGIILPSRGDFEAIADSGDDDIGVTVKYHPGYHFASEAV